jgi:colanic acid biosynthesis glycosyl transferase WcaI
MPYYHPCIIFCGDGVSRKKLEDQCSGLNFILFLDLQPAESLSEFLKMADIHLLPQRADAADLVMPSKLTGMLASGRPILACANSGTEVASVVQCCGLVVPPEDPESFYKALSILIADSTLVMPVSSVFVVLLALIPGVILMRAERRA